MCLNIIIAFPKLQDANNIKNMLIQNGFEVSAVATTGALAISYANEMDAGIVICGYRLSDMRYNELNGYLPQGFDLLLLATPQRLAECTERELVSLSMPFRIRDLISTLEMMTGNIRRKQKREREKKKLRQRTAKEQETIAKAKMLLMDRNHMTEEEAHRYIQKNSMDSGTNLVEMAEMILLTNE